jgi:hypothetical protein
MHIPLDYNHLLPKSTFASCAGVHNQVQNYFVGIVENLYNPHLPEYLHLNNPLVIPAAIVVNLSRRRLYSVEPAEWLLVQNNIFKEKKSSRNSSFTFLSMGKWYYLFFRRTNNSRPDNAAIARNGLSDDEYVPVFSGTVFIVTGGSVFGRVVVRGTCVVLVAVVTGEGVKSSPGVTSGITVSSNP